MREIKFRAWDKQQKIMLYLTDIILIGERWTSSHACGIDAALTLKLPTHDAKGNYQEDPSIEDTNNLEWMQYTGLKDKNGKEIYEGDIVEYENNNSGYGRPRHEEISRDVIPELTKHEDYDMDFYWTSGEVIGNIYENPELLETK